MVIFLTVIILFLLGKWWLGVLQRRVSAEESVFIERKYWGWIPILIYFLLLIVLPRYASITLYSFCTFFGYFQISGIIQKKIKPVSSFTHALLFTMILSTVPYYFLSIQKTILIAIIFGSVFSDISAYSFAKLSANKHFLPEFINKNKTFEGIIGGLAGPYFIIPLMTIFGISYSLWPFIFLLFLIGASSNIGDMMNSVIKKQIGIKDWGKTLPGHGGIFDRFVSFYMSYAVISIITLLVFPYM